jgi:hypothetical protein
MCVIINKCLHTILHAVSSLHNISHGRENCIVHHGHYNLNEGLTTHRYRFQYEEFTFTASLTSELLCTPWFLLEKRWQLNRTEPQGLELFEAIPEIKDIFVKAEWYDFLCAFEGHHTGLAMLFM